MRTATSVLIQPTDTFELGDGWGGSPDCVQILDNGDPTISLRFLDVDSIDNLISVLSALSLDTRMRNCERAMVDYHATEGRVA